MATRQSFWLVGYLEVSEGGGTYIATPPFYWLTTALNLIKGLLINYIATQLVYYGLLWGIIYFLNTSNKIFTQAPLVIKYIYYI